MATYRLQSYQEELFVSQDWVRRTVGGICSVDELIHACIVSLESLYDDRHGLFVHKRDLLTRLNLDTSLRYSAIALIGLYEAKAAGYDTRLPLGDIAASVAQAARSARNVGDVALSLWASVGGSTGHELPLWTILRNHDQLRGAGKIRLCESMELAWVTTALILLWERTGIDDARRLADVVRGRLAEARSSRTGLFAYTGQNSYWSLSGYAHRRFGTFANQSYPIYALATYGHVLRDEEALRQAEQCADAVVRLQGDSGQWWWVYDVLRGCVAEKYPVFSVHQHGMGPMALDRIRLAGGKPYAAPIERSLRWLVRNELNAPMIDPVSHHFRRAILRRGASRYLYHLNIAATALGLRSVRVLDFPARLKVLEQTRPYCLGWALLYLCGTRN